MTELIQLTGSVIKELNVETQEPDAKEYSSIVEEIVYKSIMYSVGTRCGFDLSGEEQDLSQIVNFSDEEVVYRLGSLVCDVSCSVLKEFNKNLKDMERQKEASAERRIAYGRNIVNLHGGGRGSESAIGYADGKVSGEEQAGGSQFHNGDVADKGAGEDAGRRNRSESDRVEVSLEQEQRDNEIESELNEINSFGNQKEAKYHQASFFDADFSNTQPLKYSYVEPKKELIVRKR